MTTGWPAPSLRHVSRMTDAVGVVEHADGPVPRADLGYRTDDAARALSLAVAMNRDSAAERIATVATSFLIAGYIGGGTLRLRRRPDEGWTDDAPSDDVNGQALLGLGRAAAVATWAGVRSAAAALFADAAAFRSPHPRATAYAVLGAVEVLYAEPRNRRARCLVGDGLDTLVAFGPGDPGPWRWPAPRLTYTNALLPHATLAAAHSLDRPAIADDALDVLDWLVGEETRGGWFSFTPVGGRAVGDPKPGFDQQPIEAWAMADACALASKLTGGARWSDAVRRAGRWFLGDNDAGAVMFDPETGGGFDALGRHGVKADQGAEASLAYTSTMHTVWSVDGLPRLTAISAGGGVPPRRCVLSSR